MQNVESSIIILYAVVRLALPEILSQDAILGQVIKLYSYFAACTNDEEDTIIVFFSVIQPQLDETRDPCVPSPCGMNSMCRNVGDQASCSCSPNYLGSPPNCRPECTTNTDCISSHACINEKCRDPCPGSCGLNARCSVFNHVAVCTCLEGYKGDPFTSCVLKPQQGMWYFWFNNFVCFTVKII